MAPHSSWPAASRICRLTALPEPSSNGGSASGWTTECLGRWWFAWENVRKNHQKTMEKTWENHWKPWKTHGKTKRKHREKSWIQDIKGFHTGNFGSSHHLRVLGSIHDISLLIDLIHVYVESQQKELFFKSSGRGLCSTSSLHLFIDL